jgi:hypothetical protein
MVGGETTQEMVLRVGVEGDPPLPPNMMERVQQFGNLSFR